MLHLIDLSFIAPRNYDKCIFLNRAQSHKLRCRRYATQPSLSSSCEWIWHALALSLVLRPNRKHRAVLPFASPSQRMKLHFVCVWQHFICDATLTSQFIYSKEEQKNNIFPFPNSLYLEFYHQKICFLLAIKSMFAVCGEWQVTGRLQIEQQQKRTMTSVALGWVGNSLE